MTAQSVINIVTLIGSHGNLTQQHPRALAPVIAQKISTYNSTDRHHTQQIQHTHIMAYKPNNTAELETISCIVQQM